MNKINQINTAIPFSFKSTPIKQQPDPEILTENTKLKQELDIISELGKSQINFKGNFRLNKKDIIFLGGLAASFGLSLDILDKMKENVSNFLIANNLTSINDICGEENMDKQCELAETIQEAANLNDEQYEAVVDKVIEECSNEYDYYSNDIEIAEMEKIIMKNFQKRKANDNKFINSIAYTFGLNEEEQKVLENIFAKYMKEFGIPTLKSLDSEEKANETSEIIEAISKKFNLSENDEALITFEFARRVFADENNYFPLIHPIDRFEKTALNDLQVLRKILSNYKINLNDFEKLHYALKQDAYDRGLTSIFETFNGKNKYPTVDKILDSENFKDIKMDVLIDLFDTSKNIKQISSDLNTQKETGSNNYIKHCAIVYMLDKDFDFSEADIKSLKQYFLSEEMDLNDTKNIWKAAYEIPELIDLPSSAGDKIIEAIKTVNNLSENELLDYNFNYCQMIMSKK